MLRLAPVLAVSLPFAHAIANCTPLSYEVKFSLLDTVLDAGAPNHDMVSAFALQAPPEERTWAYFDTEDKELNAEGWVVRIRHNEGADVELTYKKRFPVPHGLPDALTVAAGAGFSEDPEVDWTTAKQTLSFDESKKLSLWSLNGTAVPSADWGLCMLVNDIPDKIANWKHEGWGTQMLKRARQYGPVTAHVWFGEWNGVEVLVEVLAVRTEDESGMELSTELSFEADEGSASALRDKAMRELEERGWLDREGRLKTGLILDRY